MKRLVRYLNKREKAIITLIETPRLIYTADTYHELRIEIKKLNALLSLIQFSSKNFELKKITKPFQKIFQRAGKIREIQVEVAFLKQHSFINLPTCMKFLQASCQKREDLFFENLDKNTTKRLQHNFRAIEKGVKKVDHKTTKGYLQQIEKTITLLVGQHPIKSQEVHKLRKQLKTLNYNKKCLLPKKEHLMLSKADALSELIGQWHDYQVMLRHLTRTEDMKGIKTKELNQLEKIKTQLILKSEVLFGKINKTLQDSALF